MSFLVAGLFVAACSMSSASKSAGQAIKPLRVGVYDSRVAAKSALFEDTPAHSFVAGIPAIEHRKWKRAVTALKSLDTLRREVLALRRRLDELDAGQGGTES